MINKRTFKDKSLIHATALIAVALLLLFAASCKKQLQAAKSASFGTIFGDGNEHTLERVVQTSDGDFLVCGTVKRGLNGFNDGYLLKLNENLDVQWYKNYGGPYEDYLTGLATDEDGNIMLVGTSYSFGSSIDTNEYLNNLVYIVFADKSGNKLWDTAYLPPAGFSLKGSSQAGCVAYVKNKRFCVGGQTTRFIKDGTFNAFALTIDEAGNIDWLGNYYDSTGITPSENIVNMQLCNDGNVMLFLNEEETNSGNYGGYLIKTPVTAGSFSPNRNQWIGGKFTMLNYAPVNSYLGKAVTRTPLQVIRDEDAVIGNCMRGTLLFVRNKGRNVKEVFFEKPISNLNMNTRDDKLLVTGFYEKSAGLFPFWGIADLDGKILEQNYSDFDDDLAAKITYRHMFLNTQNQRVVFGVLTNGADKKIIILKFNSSGKLI